MKHIALSLLLLSLAACSWFDSEPSYPNYKTEAEAGGAQTVIGLGSGYWRPISAPNVLMNANESQGKLEFDLSQCKCGNFPKNIPTPIMMKYQPDQQRMVETGRNGSCAIDGAVLAECMRSRGWEPTLCAGRLPTQTGSYCGM